MLKFTEYTDESYAHLTGFVYGDEGEKLAVDYSGDVEVMYSLLQEYQDEGYLVIIYRIQ